MTTEKSSGYGNHFSNIKILKNLSAYLSKELVAAAGFDVETPIVNALIGNLNGTLPVKSSDIIRCELCDCEVNSSEMFYFHVNGVKHIKKVERLKILKELKTKGEKIFFEKEKHDLGAISCNLCNLEVNSVQQLEIHLEGSKHKKKAETIRIADGEDPTPPPKKKKEADSKEVVCVICNLTLNSRNQFDQHTSSRRHLIKINPSLSKPRPKKPKFKKGLKQKKIKFVLSGDDDLGNKNQN